MGQQTYQVTWVVDVFASEEDIDRLAENPTPKQIAEAGYQRIVGHTMMPVLEVRMPDGTEYQVDLEDAVEEQ